MFYSGFLPYMFVPFFLFSCISFIVLLSWMLHILIVFLHRIDLTYMLLVFHFIYPKFAATAKLPQSCPTLCYPIDRSPPGSPVPGILKAKTLEWVAISFSNAWKWKVTVKSLSCVQLLATPWTTAYQAPPSMGLSRQEYWSGLPLPKVINPLSHIWFANIFFHSIGLFTLLVISFAVQRLFIICISLLFFSMLLGS